MFYVVPTYKSVVDESPRRLSDYEEQRHTLLEVCCVEGRCIARFPNGNFAFPAELEEQLHKLVGHKCAILKLDGEYHIRNLDVEGHA